MFAFGFHSQLLGTKLRINIISTSMRFWMMLTCYLSMLMLSWRKACNLFVSSSFFFASAAAASAALNAACRCSSSWICFWICSCFLFLTLLFLAFLLMLHQFLPVLSKLGKNPKIQTQNTSKYGQAPTHGDPCAVVGACSCDFKCCFYFCEPFGSSCKLIHWKHMFFLHYLPRPPHKLRIPSMIRSYKI